MPRQPNISAPNESAMIPNSPATMFLGIAEFEPFCHVNFMWKEISLDEKPLFDSWFQRFPCRLSDYSFTNCWIWNEERHYHYMVLDHCLLIRYTDHGETVYLMPVGDVDTQIFKMIGKNAMRAVDENRLSTLLPYFQHAEEEQKHFDYLYRFEDLLTLHGNALQPKRNLIHQFEEQYEWHYEPIDLNNRFKVSTMQEKWISLHPGDAALQEEHVALTRCLKDFQALKLMGGCLIVDDQVIAYTVGELLTHDTLVIHGEKALPSFKGAYQAINQKFLEHTSQVAWVNREEALGIPSLEQAKQSYHPARLLKKFKLWPSRQPS